MPYLVHVGYVLMLAGFLARDILVLRSLLVSAQIIVAVYAFLVAAVPAIGAWNALFAGINIVWVVLILRERRAVRVPAELQRLYDLHFAAMTPREFLAWWKLGTRETIRSEPLTRDGEHPSALYFILGGQAQVRRGDRLITELTRGAFVGEMSLMTAKPANADVDAVGEVDVQRWSRADLEALRNRDLVMWTKLQSAIGADLVAKIQRGDQRLAGA